ncbi:hypothetical protein EDB85DRAFT_1267923 [Lactarius pseudohatsudake]|nr:hypothetical protein EDB85DRAFT_1267923 [Lactarius pseudohatsudake]
MRSAILDIQDMVHICLRRLRVRVVSRRFSLAHHADDHIAAAHTLPPAAPPRTTASARRLVSVAISDTPTTTTRTRREGERENGKKMARRRVFPTRRTRQEDPRRRVEIRRRAQHQVDGCMLRRELSCCGDGERRRILGRKGRDHTADARWIGITIGIGTCAPRSEPFLARSPRFSPAPPTKSSTNARGGRRFTQPHHLRRGFTQRPRGRA